MSVVGSNLTDMAQTISERLRAFFTQDVTQRSLSDGRPIARSLATPESWGSSVHLDVIGELYGLADGANFPVTRKLAHGLDVVNKGRRVLATNIGRLRLTNRKGNGPAPLQMPYLQQPEASRPLSDTLIWTADALYYYPRTWWVVLRTDAAGWPARGGVKLLDRDDAQFDADGKLIRAWGTPITDYPRVIEFNAPDCGLLHDSQKLLRRAVILDRAASLAESNPVPSINLQNQGSRELEPAQITELLDSWMQARKKYGVAYTDKTVQATPMGIVDSQLMIGAQERMDVKLARATGLPAWAADVALEGSTLNYQNRQSRAWELIDLFLSTYMTPIVSRLSMPDATPLGWSTEFTTDDLTRPDMKTRFDTYKVGLDGGFIDQAWIDAQEGQTLKMENAE